MCSYGNYGGGYCAWAKPRGARRAPKPNPLADLAGGSEAAARGFAGGCLPLYLLNATKCRLAQVGAQALCSYANYGGGTDWGEAPTFAKRMLSAVGEDSGYLLKGREFGILQTVKRVRRREARGSTLRASPSVFSAHCPVLSIVMRELPKGIRCAHAILSPTPSVPCADL